MKISPSRARKPNEKVNWSLSTQRDSPSVALHDARSAWKTTYVVIWSTKRPCGHVVIQTLLFSAQVHPPLINQRQLSGVHLEMLESIDEAADNILV